MPKNSNPRVYLDISIGGRGGGRIIFELFPDVTPRMVENFRGLCTGEYGVGRTTKKKLSYEGCSVFRSKKGSYIQSGDFQFNNGDGGESVYGGTFNDEDFTRRHTQAGVLSMANKGRNTNGSQFFITLKRAPMLDGRHIAFGQVVEGMDVVRAIAQVPTDRDEKPRVPVIIVGCGQVDRKASNGADPYAAMGKAISDLAQEVDPVPVANEAQKAKAILGGKQGGAAIPEDSAKGGAAASEAAEGEEGGATRPPRNERERRLFELRLKMNAGRASNSKEVVEEQKREADPDYARKKGGEERERKAKRGQEKAEGQESAEKGMLPKGKDYLMDTVETVELREAKKKKGNPDAFGWDVFNADSLYRAHDKKLKTMQFDEKRYNEQKAQLEEENDTSLFAGHGFQASEEAKDRLEAAMDKANAKKKEFSRRRDFIAEEDVTYVNERNRHFNRKMDRYFGAYTEETRQNLERGTAL
mmetsp:Transcript_87387/g.187417  ORF Transcript_87387/g.187417 Transcript_87387/m.187417 type:complete len:471 (-) Transcript_87387:82-1494(-)